MLPSDRLAKRRLVLPAILLATLAANALVSAWAISTEAASRFTFTSMIQTAYESKAANEALQVAKSFDGPQRAAYLASLGKVAYGEPVTIDRLAKDVDQAKARLAATSDSFKAESKSTRDAWVAKWVVDALLALVALLLAAREVSGVRRGSTTPVNLPA